MSASDLHAQAPSDAVKAVVFDVFGTLVDWRSSLIREMENFGPPRGLSEDWAKFAEDWRALYQPAMEQIRQGRRPFTILDVLHRENLDTLLQRYAISGLTEADKRHLTRIWHRLDPWPDVVEGLTRLKLRFIIAPMSNGNIGLMTRLAKYGGLPWDAILGAEVSRAYKPMPEAYLGAANALNLAPEHCLMAAAHNDDLIGARAVGLRTAFILRPTEHGPGQTTDLNATSDWDIITSSVNGLADALGCPAHRACA